MQKAYIWFKRGAIVIAITGLIGLMVFMIITHQAMDEAVSIKDNNNVYSEDNVIVVEAENPIANLVFYPGALVESEAYLVMADMLSVEGVTVYIVEMPLNLSILNADAFEKVYDEYPSDLPWYLGGHSLGGAMTSRNDMEPIDGLILLAAYIDVAHDLSDETIDVLSITASEDEVLDRVSFEESKPYLPDSTVYREIEGGNHANFAYYGLQRGDGDSTISRETQHQIYTQYIIDFVKGDLS
jgi:hypothetical protein